MSLVTIRPVPYEGQLLPVGLTGGITGEGDYPGSYRVLLDDDEDLPTSGIEVELTRDQFMTAQEANAATRR